MKRTNEFAVGLAVLLALALVVGGRAVAERDRRQQEEDRRQARFRTVGGLGVGAPVTLRGVKVGRVEAIRLVEDEWVETEFSIDRDVDSARQAGGHLRLGQPVRRVERQHHLLRAAAHRPNLRDALASPTAPAATPGPAPPCPTSAS